MATRLPDVVAALFGGRLSTDLPWPFAFGAVAGDVVDGFRVKSAAGQPTRAMARNGRVLLVSRLELRHIEGAAVSVRLQTWHRAILPGDRPQPWGVLVWIGAIRERVHAARYKMRVERGSAADCELAIELGGLRYLCVRETETWTDGPPD